ncbi:hypothetical protein [Bradyrhizobium sp.]|uniref:hypothetical protein n=1 Tax=Bradyrhizobium sp. TaxID=376 RepID=UPI00260E5F02|nr:hypothetical protein [Bradyrhizobium sp.]
MTRQNRLTVFIASIATIASIDMLGAQVRQCSAERPAGQHGYWSYRLIDGRKCWYEGKRMLSKSLLAWPLHAPVKTRLEVEPAPQLRDKPGEPLDANAWDRNDVDTFETRWRAISTVH